MPALWLRLDEIENAIDNLETCGFLLAHRGEPIRWKWAIITLHQALYGFAICAVKGTDDLSVLVDPDKSNSNLISVWKALDRVRDPKYLWPSATPLTTSPEEDKAIQRVADEFRNGFEHFRPAGWSIEVAGLPTLLKHVLRVVEFLALGSGAVRYSDEAQEDRARTALVRIRDHLSASDQW